MARYAEWNKFIGNLKTDKYGNTTVNEVGIAFEKAAADVVPKREVEQIFEEIRKNSTYIVTDYDEEVEVVFWDDIAELKKKYTGGKT